VHEVCEPRAEGLLELGTGRSRRAIAEYRQQMAIDAGETTTLPSGIASSSPKCDGPQAGASG
jgi:hypothetical protein